MLKSKAISHIQRRLGFRTDLAASILEELQGAQTRLEQGIVIGSGGTFLPWFLITEVASISTVIGEERIPVQLSPPEPTFLQEWEDDALWVFNANSDTVEAEWTALVKDDIQFLRSAHPGTGVPLAYAVDGKYFRLFPTPDAIYTLKMIYYGADAPLVDTSDDENKWLKYAPNLMIGEAGFQLASSARDDKASAYFQGLIQPEITRLFSAGEARAHTNRAYVMGGDD